MPVAGRIQWYLAVIMAIVAIAGVSRADTIYLKNGRVIRTSSATIEGDRVLFTQYGHPVAIPLSQVERIEEDEYEDPSSAPTPTPTPTRPPTPSTQPAASPGTTPPASGSTGSQVQDPEQTEEYWQNRVRAINVEAEQLKLEIQSLRRIERAFLFSHRSTADTRREIEDVEARIDANEQAMPNLRREARQKGIPAGWLRLPSGG